MKYAFSLLHSIYPICHNQDIQIHAFIKFIKNALGRISTHGWYTTLDNIRKQIYQPLRYRTILQFLPHHLQHLELCYQYLLSDYQSYFFHFPQQFSVKRGHLQNCRLLMKIRKHRSLLLFQIALVSDIYFTLLNGSNSIDWLKQTLCTNLTLIFYSYQKVMMKDWNWD